MWFDEYDDDIRISQLARDADDRRHSVKPTPPPPAPPPPRKERSGIRWFALGFFLGFLAGRL